MRNIYTDEAGTSALEPTSVVVALLVHADTQWRRGAVELRRLFQGVPERYHAGFAFHAKYISAANKYPEWTEDSRIAFMRSVMELPSKLGIPIAIAAVKRGTAARGVFQGVRSSEPTITDHVLAFALCMASADSYLRTHCGDEMAQVIAEDLQKIKKDLRNAIHSMKVSPLILDTTLVVGDAAPIQSQEIYKVERIIDEVHFMERDDAPFLQMADACAFGIRRSLRGQKYGDAYIKAILGDAAASWIESPSDIPWNKYTGVFFPTTSGGQVWHPFLSGQSS